MLRTHLATPHDTRFIATCLQHLMGSVRPYTIAGCAGLENHIIDVIRGERGLNATFIVCSNGDAPCGVTEWRVSDRRVHLNHIFVLPEHRGKGVGSFLLRDGLHLFASSGRAPFSVDAFASNRLASDWYRSLGLTPFSEQSWRIRPIADVTRGADDVLLLGLEEADREHSRYGFSQISLEIDGKKHHIGRLREKYFRTTSATILENPAGLSALSRLDPRRMLLTILGENNEPTSNGLEVARSVRYQTTCTHLRNSLSGSLHAVGT